MRTRWGPSRSGCPTQASEGLDSHARVRHPAGVRCRAGQARGPGLRGAQRRRGDHRGCGACRRNSRRRRSGRRDLGERRSIRLQDRAAVEREAVRLAVADARARAVAAAAGAGQTIDRVIRIEDSRDPAPFSTSAPRWRWHRWKKRPTRRSIPASLKFARARDVHSRRSNKHEEHEASDPSTRRTRRRG